MAAKTLIDQGLFGYSGGHRWLAGSLDLDADSARQLRAATDMSFGGKSKSYFSLMPLPEMNVQAFARTWPAPDWLRSGAVWSHVLFVNFAALGRITHTSALSNLFRRPKANDAKSFEKELSRYGRPLEFTGDSTSTKASFDTSLLHTVLSSLYSSNEPISMPYTGSQDLEEALLAIHEQQWPRLRRAFSARTRLRPSESQWRADLEVVERSSQAPPKAKTDPWLQFLLQDLEDPRAEFRSFISRYGAESSGGRSDMPLLVDVFQAIEARAQPENVVRLIISSFSDESSMRVLKRDLLGPDSTSAPHRWQVKEPTRLQLAFLAGRSVDFSDLAIGERLVSALSESPPKAFSDLPMEHLTPAQFETVIGDITQFATTQLAADLAISNPDLGLLVATRKPEILEIPAVWGALDADLTATVFENLEKTEQDRILESLVRASAVDALVLMCERNRKTWWRLLLLVADDSLATGELVAAASVMRNVLDRFGAAAIDVPERAPRTPHQAIAVLLGADLSAGLWRRVSAPTWVGITSKKRSGRLVEELPAFALDRLNAVALLSSTVSNDAETRQIGWQAAFPYLHERLADRGFDGEAWRVLDNALPAGPEWDRCLRLRRGVLNEMRREAWTPEKVAVIVESAGSQGREISEQLRQDNASRNRKGVIEGILDFLFGR